MQKRAEQELKNAISYFGQQGRSLQDVICAYKTVIDTAYSTLGIGHIIADSVATLTRSKSRVANLRANNAAPSAIKAANNAYLDLKLKPKFVSAQQAYRNAALKSYRAAKKLGIGAEIARREYTNAQKLLRISQHDISGKAELFVSFGAVYEQSKKRFIDARTKLSKVYEEKRPPAVVQQAEAVFDRRERELEIAKLNMITGATK